MRIPHLGRSIIFLLGRTIFYQIEKKKTGQDKAQVLRNKNENVSTNHDSKLSGCCQDRHVFGRKESRPGGNQSQVIHHGSGCQDSVGRIPVQGALSGFGRGLDDRYRRYDITPNLDLIFHATQPIDQVLEEAGAM